MQALYWDGQRLRLDTAYHTPQLEAHTALLRVRLAGICATDLQIFQGYMGFRGIPGHELVGEVCAGPTDLIGKRVVSEINFACGHCPTCEVSGDTVQPAASWVFSTPMAVLPNMLPCRR